MPPYIEGALGPEQRPGRVLCDSPEEAKRQFMETLKALREEFPGSADDINAALDELSVSGDTFQFFFDVGSAEWIAWFRPCDVA